MILGQFRPIQNFINDLSKIQEHPVDREACNGTIQIPNFAKYEGQYRRISAEYEPVTNRFLITHMTKTKEEAVRLAQHIDKFYKDWDAIQDKIEEKQDSK